MELYIYILYVSHHSASEPLLELDDLGRSVHAHKLTLDALLAFGEISIFEDSRAEREKAEDRSGYAEDGASSEGDRLLLKNVMNRSFLRQIPLAA